MLKRRDLVTGLAAGMATLGATAAFGQQPKDDHGHDHGGEGHKGHHSPAHDECLKDCTDCARICSESFHHALTDTSKKCDPAHIQLMLDCACFCGHSAEMMSRHSALMKHSCEACAKACDACAEECEKHADDPMMKKCAEMCRRCAKSCRAMVGAK
jgi:hypothetical protein